MFEQFLGTSFVLFWKSHTAIILPNMPVSLQSIYDPGYAGEQMRGLLEITLIKQKHLEELTRSQLSV